MLAEVLQRDLALSDADPTALAQVRPKPRAPDTLSK